MRRALELVGRSDDDLTDVELLTKGSDDFWYITLCLDSLHRLPSEVDRILLCREYTALQAHAVVQKAMTDLARVWGKE